jgi:O-antigen ligase
MAGNTTITEQGEKFSPTVRYKVTWSKPIPMSVRWSFLLFVSAIPFESLYVAPSLSVARVVGVFFFGCYLLFYSPLFGKKSWPRPHPAVWWFLGYLAVYSMSALFIDPQFIEEILTFVVTYLQLVVFLWITPDLLKNQKMGERVLLAYSMSAAYLSLGMIFGLPGIEVQTGLDGRISAIGQNANGLAGMMALAVHIIVSLCITNVFKHFLSRILLSLLILPLLLAIVKTGSRGGTLALLSGALVYLLPCWRSKRAVTVMILTICGIGALLYLIATEPLMMKRWQDAQGGDLSTRQLRIPAALEMGLERPLFGWHPVEYKYELAGRIGEGGRSADPHNLLASMLAEVGIAGAIPFFIGYWLCFRAAWTARRSHLGLMPLSLMVSVLAMHMSGPNVVWKPFWLVMGLTLAAASTAVMKRARYKRIFWSAYS